MRLCLLTVLCVLVSLAPACSQQSREQIGSNGGKSAGSSSRHLLLEVLQTDAGVGGTNQFVYIRIFTDGSVEYHPRRSQELRREHVTRAHIPEEELAATAKALAREDVVVLPSMFKSTFTPIDFNWVLDFAIPRGGQRQKITVVNFSPSMAVRNNKAYPEALVRLVCAAWVVRKQLSTETPDLSQDCRDFAGQN